jgi:hypothetical protein
LVPVLVPAPVPVLVPVLVPAHIKNFHFILVLVPVPVVVISIILRIFVPKKMNSEQLAFYLIRIIAEAYSNFFVLQAVSMTQGRSESL